ncbi:hypothetical protein N234_25645 [Ralstonia pickettii DTP0602]|nr:hypothetical protein N234_25645 [Ralstonia pickettii DTP0602]
MDPMSTCTPFIMKSPIISRLAACAALLFALASSCFAQAYPSRPVTLVVAYPAGGDTDAVARILAEKLTARLGQPVVVENRPGAGGAIGNAFVAKAAADGHTLLFSPSALPVLQHVLKVSASAAYDPVKDFTPIAMVGDIPLVLITATKSGIRSVPDLVAQAKAGRAMTYGSPGNGSPMHFGGEMFNHAAGIAIVHTPYKGVAPMVNDVLGGHVTFGYATPGAAAGHIASGKLLGLATLSRQRSTLEVVAKLPTLIEQGYKDVEVAAWLGLLGPKNLPPEIANTLNRHVNDILKMNDVKERLALLGVVPVGGAGAVLGRQIVQDDARFKALAGQFAIRVD